MNAHTCPTGRKYAPIFLVAQDYQSRVAKGALEVSNEEERKLTTFQRLAIDYWGTDEKTGFKQEVAEALVQHAEIYAVYRVLKWGVTYLIGPAGALFLLTELLTLIRSGS